MFLEFRRYIVRPEHREAWVRIMEEKIFPFILPKGMVVLGSFRALHDKSQYAWMRSFRDDQERVRLYKAVYESEYWGKEIIPAADKMLEWEGIKNVRILPLLGQANDLFIDYGFQESQLVELQKFHCHPGCLESWLALCHQKLIPWLNDRKARVLDSFSMPEFPDTHLLMFSCPDEATLSQIRSDFAHDPEFQSLIQGRVAEMSLETPTLTSTNPLLFKG